MNKLLPIVQQLMMLGAMNTPAPKKADRTSQFVFGFAAVLAVASIVYVIVAISYWVKLQYEPDKAALVISGVILSIALLVAALGYAYNTIRKSKIDAVGEELKDKAYVIAKSFTHDLENPIRTHPKTSLAVGALIGYWLASRL